MTDIQLRYPEEVVITDVPEQTGSDGTNTPAGDNEDDFFSSWDKPTIKRPSNPPSRTGTPRSASPFLKPGANGNGLDRPKSPLSASSDGSKPSTPAAIPAAKPTAVRKTAGGAAPKKNILGAKKKGLGAKKVVAGDASLDFEEAERKAREEAERIEKLGYDPDAEAAEAAASSKANPASTSSIVSPTPVSPPRGGFGASKPERSSQDVERLGMGVGRLGFGQVGSAKQAAAPKKMGGFGSVSKPVADDSEKYAREKFGTQKGISSDEFFGRNNYDPQATKEAKERLTGLSSFTPFPFSILLY
jgi:ADP-ribosylation factor GTPase-activating protein 2/3